MGRGGCYRWHKKKVTWRELAVKLVAATRLPLDTILSMSWEEVTLAAEAEKWREYAEWSRVRWIGAVVATIQTGKRVTPSQLLPLDLDGAEKVEVDFEPDPERIEMARKLFKIKTKSDGKG